MKNPPKICDISSIGIFRKDNILTHTVDTSLDNGFLPTNKNIDKSFPALADTLFNSGMVFHLHSGSFNFSLFL